MTNLVTFRLSDEDAGALQYREGPKGVFYTQYSKPRTKRILAEPVALRQEKDDRPPSNSTLTAEDAHELLKLIDAYSNAVIDAQWADGQDERRAASEVTSNAYSELYGWINGHTDDWFRLFKIQQEGRAAEQAGSEAAS